MAVTELATLLLKPGKSWNDILHLIRTAGIEQTAWSGYPVYFFDILEKPGQIILLSGWKSVEAHSQWIVSQTNQKLIQALSPSLDVLSLVHLTIEPSPRWEDAQAIIYERFGEEKHGESSLESVDCLWEGEGTDVEAKTMGIFRLVAFSSIDAMNMPEESGENVVYLIKRNIEQVRGAIVDGDEGVLTNPPADSNS